jgi:hypothetical protein
MQTASSTPKTSFLNLPSQWGLIVTVILGLGAYAGLAGLHLRYGTLRDGITPDTLAWYALAFAAYVGAIVWTEMRPGVEMKLVWAAAIGCRLILLLTVPTLSDDVYRYVWDGHLANQGVSPYAYPVDSPALDQFDIPPRALVNNRWMASPYLPAAQLLFAGLMRLLPQQPLVFQVTMVIFDLLSGLIIARLLAITGLPGRRIVIYLWNPLVIVEVAHGAHVDAWMIFLTMLTLWLIFSPQRGQMSTWLAPVTLAGATLTKIAPLLLLPVLFRRWRWSQRLLYGVVTLALMLPSAGRAGWGLTGPLDGTGLFGAIRIYADQWNFNSGLFHWLEVDLLQSAAVQNASVIEATDWAKRIVILVLLIVLATVWWQARPQIDNRTTLRLMAGPLMAYILLNTTIHPWYLLILLACLPFLTPAAEETPWRWFAVLPWLYLSGALSLSYLTYLDPLDFRELEWVRRTEWLPTLGLLGLWIILASFKRLKAQNLQRFD